MDLCNQLDLPLSITMAGRGTAVQSMLDLLGIESNERRIVFTVAVKPADARDSPSSLFCAL